MIIRDFVDTASSINETRKPAELKYGIPYLDRATGGIRENDLVVLGARTGAGKTELASIIAENNAKQGKRVLFYSLEAEKSETVNRIIFRNYARELYLKDNKHTSYRAYINDSIDDYDLLKQVISSLNTSCMSLTVVERQEEFMLEDFVVSMGYEAKNYDLIILDHLHHFDTDEVNEVKALKQAVKTIRDMCLYHNKPVIMIAHLRKLDRRTQALVPDIEDFYGSSEIGKEATQVITLAPYDEETTPPNCYATLFKVCKLRIDGSVARFIGKHLFNAQTKSYNKDFEVGRLTKGERELELLEFNSVPFWAKIKKIDLQTGDLRYEL